MPNLFSTPIHLGPGATAVVQPNFTGMAWYADYQSRTEADGAEGRLVMLSTFTEDWDSWECHPTGAEVVVCVSGTMTIHQELAQGHVAQVVLAAGDYAINPPGVWHTADVAEAATALFVTPGQGTTHRPR